jgi:ribonuclease M5
MLQPIVVVEGIHDQTAVLAAVEAEVICTGGFAFGRDVEARLRRGHATRGLLVLTDPDAAGKQIRARVTALVGPCLHAHLPRRRATRARDGNVGVENASPADIRAAIAAARPATALDRHEFTAQDLFDARLNGCASARARRAALGETLSLGFGTARQLLRRLNRYGVTREEFDRAVDALDG